MEFEKINLLSTLNKKDVDTLMDLYYTDNKILKDKNFGKNGKNSLELLVEKNLITTKLEKNENKIFLTDEGLEICGTYMFQHIAQKQGDFYKKIQDLPDRAVSCLVNRIIYHESMVTETGKIEPVNEPYSLDESTWYERVLFEDERFVNIMNKFYEILENIGFVKNIEGERFSSPEVEEFLKKTYTNTMDLTWSEEDSLRYYYFFYIYAKDQKNLINFSGRGEDYKSMFFDEDTNTTEYWYSSNIYNPREMISSIGLSEKRVIDFLEEMKKEGIVNERYYPLSNSSFFSEQDKIFVIQDINNYMQFIKSKFLSPVVDLLVGK